MGHKQTYISAANKGWQTTLLADRLKKAGEFGDDSSLTSQFIGGSR
jgi:hypothetical protein